ncbi:MAG: glycosyltransferase [Pseudomonadota bacterium]
MQDDTPRARIAYLAGEYPKVSHTFILREIAALRQNGFDVLPCSVRKTGEGALTGPEERAEAALTFNIISAAANPMRLIGDHIGILASRPGAYFRALGLAFSLRSPGLKALLYQIIYFVEAVVLAAELKRRGVIHLHNHFAASSCTVALLASEVSGIPFSFTLHGPADFFEALRWRLDAKLARARFVSCISHFCRSQGMMHSAPEHWSKLHIVHCGVEPDRYDGADPTTRTGRRLLFVGRLSGVKGLPVLIEAFAGLRQRHPDLELTLVGDGEGRAPAEARVKELGLTESVTFTGYQSQGEVAQHLAQTDIFVLPSFAEGVPVVLMEAMASRVPVVATRVAGVPELVTDGESGFVVPPGDTESLVARLDLLLSDSDLRLRMGDAGRAHVVDQFNIDAEARWLAKILDSYATEGPYPGLRPDTAG